MKGVFLASFVIGTATFCFVYFLTDDKEWKKHGGKGNAALKAGAFMFLLVAALCGLGLA